MSENTDTTTAASSNVVMEVVILDDKSNSVYAEGETPEIRGTIEIAGREPIGFSYDWASKRWTTDNVEVGVKGEGESAEPIVRRFRGAKTVTMARRLAGALNIEGNGVTTDERKDKDGKDKPAGVEYVLKSNESTEGPTE